MARSWGSSLKSWIVLLLYSNVFIAVKSVNWHDSLICINIISTSFDLSSTLCKRHNYLCPPWSFGQLPAIIHSLPHEFYSWDRLLHHFASYDWCLYYLVQCANEYDNLFFIEQLLPMFSECSCIYNILNQWFLSCLLTKSTLSVIILILQKSGLFCTPIQSLSSDSVLVGSSASGTWRSGLSGQCLGGNWTCPGQTVWRCM